MKYAAIALIVISVGVIAYFSSLEPAAPSAPAETIAPVRDDVTLRRTTAGEIVGFQGDHGARTWLGVPFAAPPLGELRWRPPEPPIPWKGVREALSVSAICPQLQANTGTGGPDDPAAVRGDEDCLYLNIFAPANARRLPVMVWIHGGGNSVGSGTTYNGAMLATGQDVVVITINYRIGPLGWFSHPALHTGDAAADSGNYGILDIIAALEWTRDNVAVFGGDPDRVTVFGESAGGQQVLNLVASPLAAGLFHRGIVQSGSYTALPLEYAQNYASEGGHAYSGREIVNLLLAADDVAQSDRPDDANRPGGSDAPVSSRIDIDYQQDAMRPAALRAYLRSKTVEELLAPFTSANFGMLPTPEVFADGHVLPTTSVDQLFADSQAHNPVPLILGTTRDEPSLFMGVQPRHVDMKDGVPILKNPEAYRREVKYAALAWKERGVDRLAGLLTSSGNTRVFAYRFDWDEQTNMGGVDLRTLHGAAHGADLPFTFGDFDSGFFGRDYYAESPGAEDLARAMNAYWAEFAATGDPGTGRHGNQPRWLSWGTDRKHTLVLDTPEDQGIFMLAGVVTRESIKAELASDSEVADNAERCRLYLVTFAARGGLNAEEFAQFGAEGCAEFDPATLLGP